MDDLVCKTRGFSVARILDNSRTTVIGWQVVSPSKVGGTRYHFGRMGGEKAKAECEAVAVQLNAEAEANRARANNGAGEYRSSQRR